MKKIIYSLVIMIAAGSLFTSCVNYDEPVGVQDLREAKAAYLDALSGLRAADAALKNAEAEVEKANAAYIYAQVAFQNLLNEAQKSDNEAAKAENDKAIAAAKAAAEEAALTHEKKMAELQQQLDNFKKKVAAEALTLTDDENNAISKVITNYENAIKDYNTAAAAVEKATQDLYKAVNYGFDGKTAENYKKSLESANALAAENIETYKQYISAISSQFGEWQNYIYSLEDEIALNEYNMTEAEGKEAIYQQTTFREVVMAADDAWTEWYWDNYVEDPSEENVVFALDLSTFGDLVGNIYGLVEYIVGAFFDVPGSPAPTLPAFFDDIKTYDPVMISNTFFSFLQSVSLLFIDPETGAPLVAPYFDEENENVVGFEGSVEDLTAILNGTNKYNFDEIFEGMPVFFDVKAIGLKGMIELLKENELSFNSKEVVDSLKAYADYCKDWYEDELEILKAGIEDFIANSEDVVAAYADSVAPYEAWVEALENLELAEEYADSVWVADTLAGKALVVALDTLCSQINDFVTIGAFSEFGVIGDNQKRVYSQGDANALLAAIQDVVAKKQAFLGCPTSQDSVKYWNIYNSDYSVKPASKAILDLTPEDIKQQVTKVYFDYVNSDLVRIYYGVSNQFGIASFNSTEFTPAGGVIEYYDWFNPVCYYTEITGAAAYEFTTAHSSEFGNWIDITGTWAVSFRNTFKNQLKYASLSAPLFYEWYNSTDYPEDVDFINELSEIDEIDSDPFSIILNALGLFNYNDTPFDFEPLLVPSSPKYFWNASLAPITSSDFVFMAPGYNNQHKVNTLPIICERWSPVQTSEKYFFNFVNGQPYTTLNQIDAIEAYFEAEEAAEEAEYNYNVSQFNIAQARADAANEYHWYANDFLNINHSCDEGFCQYFAADSSAFGINVLPTPDAFYYNHYNLDSYLESSWFEYDAQRLETELSFIADFDAIVSKYLKWDVFAGSVKANFLLNVSALLNMQKYADLCFDSYEGSPYDLTEAILQHVLYSADHCCCEPERGCTAYGEYLTSLRIYEFAQALLGEEGTNLIKAGEALIASIEKAIADTKAANEEAFKAYYEFLDEAFGFDEEGLCYGEYIYDEYGYCAYDSNIDEYIYPFSDQVLWWPGYAPKGGKLLEIWNEFEIEKYVAEYQELADVVRYCNARNNVLSELWSELQEIYLTYFGVDATESDVLLEDVLYTYLVSYQTKIATENTKIANNNKALAELAAGVDVSTVNLHAAQNALTLANQQLAAAQEKLALAKAEYDAVMAKYVK